MKRNKLEQVCKLLEANPKIKTEQVMAKLGTSRTYTYVLMSKARSDMARRARLTETIPEAVDSLMFGLDEVSNSLTKSDPVNNPAHYTAGGIETIDFIEAKNLDYRLGNVIKYITRADHKGSNLEDLRKAQWYLTRAIERAKG